MESIRDVLICDARMTGGNIAFVFSANPEYRTTLYDIFPTGVEEGIRINTRQLVEKETLTEEALTEWLLRTSFTSDLDSREVRIAGLVTEAAFEDMEVKRDIFEALEERLSGDTIFCTNSFVMSPPEISSRLRHRERSVGTHFWDPAHLIPLIEMVMFDATSDDAARTMMEVLASMEKCLVFCRKDVPDFAANQTQHVLWREIISVVERRIADVGAVDEVVCYSFGLWLPQLGPMENVDMVETDLAFSIYGYVLANLEDSHQPSTMLRQLKEDGKLGFRTGKGFQIWSKEQKIESAVDLNQYLVRMVYGK